jgi:predicted metal-dependent enzyme (double-stranded beta helix superfamily)
MSARPVVAARDHLIHRLDEAASIRDDAGCCRAVKQVLVDVIPQSEGLLEERFLAPAPDRYARRLVHRDPEGRYTLLAMVWGPGQGTPLHDHAGTWCVECVYRGRIKVTSFSIRGGDPERDLVAFQEEARVFAGVGEAGALIPPFEYHRIENPSDTPAVTLHVYGGEMTHCHVFEPAGDGLWRRGFRELHYTD